MQALEAIEDLFENISGLFFFQSLFFIQIFLHVAFIAVLHDDEYVLIRHEGINMLDNVVVFAGLEDFDFGLDEFLKFWFFLHFNKRDGFNGNSLLIGGIVSFVYDGACTIADHLDNRVCFKFFAD